MVDTSFELLPPVPQKRPPAAGMGRPKGLRNKRSNVLWRKAEAASPEILEQRIEEAQKLREYVKAGDMERAQIALRCGDHVLNRTWPKPRGSPVTIDLSQQIDARALLMAVINGEILPSDASSLLNALHKNGNGTSVQPQNGPGVRDLLAGKLQRLIADRRANENGTGTLTDNSAEETTEETGDKTAADLINDLLEKYGNDSGAEMSDEEYQQLMKRAEEWENR